MINRNEIGIRLKELRGSRSQEEVAQAIGVTKMSISQYERGKRVPNDDLKIKIAHYYNRSVENIFFV